MLKRTTRLVEFVCWITTVNLVWVNLWLWMLVRKFCIEKRYLLKLHHNKLKLYTESSQCPFGCYKPPTFVSLMYLFIQATWLCPVEK